MADTLWAAIPLADRRPHVAVGDHENKGTNEEKRRIDHRYLQGTLKVGAL